MSIIRTKCTAQISTGDNKQIFTLSNSALVQQHQTHQQQQSSHMIQFLSFTKRSPCFSSGQEIFLQPAVLVPWVSFFKSFNVFINHDCVLMNMAHKNFSDMDSKPLTGCTKHGIFALVLKDIIFTVSFQHTILYGKLYFYF
jgi:hypothetical protein